jgi:hypothetical protein
MTSVIRRIPSTAEDLASTGKLPACTAQRVEATRLPAWPLKPMHISVTQRKEVVMAKFHARPSLQYRYEHYDPRM